ncbi:Uu.00g130220.m01.CDS01 [Anthostomella pinea]|uniref:Uu.00g130220.m01.CDS01 n=1 Tax=Anthostomella pinea TaxID=933095 RepID=A0AAI8VIN5_9PEZI|nr:Uu.00g130220.m01.CDS01 [Anthostomella pinea]
MAPLFLGGRTNPLADFLRVPLSTYYLCHHWVGRIAILEGLIHAAFSLRRSRSDHVTISGYIAVGGLLMLLVTSPFFMRRFFRTRFSVQHGLLSLISLAAIFWHVLSQPNLVPKICVLIASALWGLTTLYRFLRTFCYLPAAKVEWCEVSETTNRICDKSSPFLRLKKGQKFLLDGPYGQDLGLRHYETVIMAAQGIGIAGVLASALDLAERQQHDWAIKASKSRAYRADLFRDRTRKVAIVWSLDENIQEEWVTMELNALKRLDEKNAFLVVWCIYPSSWDKPPPFETSQFWKCVYPKDGPAQQERYLKSLISQDIESPGRSIVVACGDPDFTTQVRETVLSQTKPHRPVNFAELEFRPPRTTSSSAMPIAESSGEKA